MNDSRFPDIQQRMPVCMRIDRALYTFVVCFSLIALLASATRADGGPGAVGGSFTVSEVRAYIPFVVGHYRAHEARFFFPFVAMRYRSPAVNDTPAVKRAMSARAETFTSLPSLSPLRARESRPTAFRALMASPRPTQPSMSMAAPKRACVLRDATRTSMSLLNSIFGILGVVLHPYGTATYQAGCSEP